MKYAICLLFLGHIYAQGSSIAPGAYDYTESDWPEDCKYGKKQTPIDLNINSAEIVKNNSIISILSNNYSIIDYGSLTLYKNQKYGLDLKGSDTLWVLKQGIPYQYYFLGFHVHIGSEHTIEGKGLDLELHLVHGKNKNLIKALNISDPDTNDYLVVGIIYKSSQTASDNPILEAMNWYTRSNITNLDLSSLVQPTKNFYHYSGSLTTPDCVEKVNWIVMDQIETMSERQSNAIKKWIQEVYPKGNARNTKELNGRNLYFIQNNLSKYLKIPLVLVLIIYLFII